MRVRRIRHVRIAADIDFGLIRRNPKIFWGYSDITFYIPPFIKIRGSSHFTMLSTDVGLEDADP